jgi:serine/threonine-protein kinase HipA
MTEMLNVSLKFSPDKQFKVGRLAFANRKTYFEYDGEFLKSGLNLSPFKLAYKEGAQVSNSSLFDGLFGVFNDSLPDGWGQLLLERHLRKTSPKQSLNPLARLRFVGENGMGALTYEPSESISEENLAFNLVETAAKVARIIEGEEENERDLISLNGSSAGVRPKVFVYIDEENRIDAKPFAGASQYLLKFRGFKDSMDAGRIEYAYHLIAKDAGLLVPPAKLISGQYFAVERFDRKGDNRLHLISASGLLHADHRMPTLDYENLLKAALVLTKKQEEANSLYRQAVFNIMAANKDDHAKNFSFLMNDKGEWFVSPAYDMTFSQGINGEQTMMVMGEGRNITKAHLVRLASVIGLKEKQANEIIDQTYKALTKWQGITEQLGISKSTIRHIETNFNFLR